jgi:DNA-directed RNA polymerase specialized sigma24 family protein
MQNQAASVPVAASFLRSTLRIQRKLENPTADHPRSTPMQHEPGSITKWLKRLQSGDAAAAGPIWNRYYAKLVSLASKQLQQNPDCAVDGEDLVQSSFRNVFLAVQNGKYPDLSGRSELWGLLYVATLNRLRQHYRELSAQKRSPLLSTQAFDPSNLEVLQTPLAEAQAADLLEHLLRRLDLEDPGQTLRKIALLYLDDHSASSIAKLLHKRKANVLISLRLIRSLWQEYEDLC